MQPRGVAHQAIYPSAHSVLKKVEYPWSGTQPGREAAVSRFI